MVISDFNIVGVAAFPMKANTPLVINWTLPILRSDGQA
jgi:hypothetical protein